MNFLNYFHYPFVILAVFIGFWASWSDIREGKIKNRLIIFGVLAGLFLYLAEILILLSFDISPRWVYFRDVLINTGLGFLAGFILWRFNVWAPGDSKLFALSAFLIPLAYYEKSYLSYFPSLALLLNIFIVVLAFIFLKIIFDIFLSAVVFFKGFFGLRPQNDSIMRPQNDSPVESLKNSMERSNLSAPPEKTGKENAQAPAKPRRPLFKTILKEFLLMPVFSLGVFVGLQIVFKTLQAWGALGGLVFLDQPVFLFLSLFMFFQIFNKISRFFKIGLVFLFMAYLAAGLRFWPEAVLTAFRQAFQFQTIYFIFGFLILNKLIDFYIEKKDIFKVPLGKLKSGMVLTAGSLGKLRELASDLEVDSDGLTEEDLGIIKDLGEKNPKLRFVEIYKAMPLAPFIFLGVILTLILKGTLISLIL